MSNLKINNVSYRYKNGERDVLSGISCTFEAGSMNAIVGPSGSGKTTLLSIMAGMDQPGSGNVSIDGDDYATLDIDQLRRERIAMVFQSFHLFPLLTALENVSYPLEQNGTKKKAAMERAGELLGMVGITADKHKRYPANLSGGEQQRIAIARAMASGAQVILADEPTGSLDNENSTRIIEILRRLAHDEGYCVVIVTHDTEIAAACDRVYRLSDGSFQDGGK